MSAELEALLDGLLAGERRALARAITLVESQRRDHRLMAEDLIERVLPHSGQAMRIGISGAPGVGKSTFIEALGMELLAAHRRPAVLTVDPSSASSGGSLLADKTRMVRLAAAPEAFVRPSPAGRTLGGVAGHTREAILLCEAAGHDVVIVETVGVGQSEYAVADLVDSFLLLLMPGAGDEISGFKRGIVELVDALVINQADGDSVALAERTANEYRSALGLLRRGDRVPWVMTASALEGRGVAEVWRQLAADHAAELGSGRLAARRRRQQSAWLSALLEEELRRRLLERPAVREALERARADVESGAVSPPRALRTVLSALDAAT